MCIIWTGAKGLDAYNTVVTKKAFGDGYVMVPPANTIYAPLIGNMYVIHLIFSIPSDEIKNLTIIVVHVFSTSVA